MGERCDKNVWEKNGWHSHQCTRLALAGDVLCKVHRAKEEKRVEAGFSRIFPKPPVVKAAVKL